MSHAHRSVTVQGVVRVLKSMGRLDAVLERLSPETRAALAAPMEQKFHPGHVIDDTMAAVGALFGETATEQVMYRTMESALSGIAGPLARIYLTITGGGPRALLTRFETLVSAGGQGFKTRWVEQSPTSGRLVISTELVTPSIADHSWKGTVEYVLAFAGVQGSVTILPREAEGRDVCLAVQWT
jgi:uncharacterized protein (TIGR02265 family)